MNIKSKIKLLVASTVGLASASLPFISINTVGSKYSGEIQKSINYNNNSINNLQTKNDGTFAIETGLENISTSVGPILLNNDKKTVESRD